MSKQPRLGFVYELFPPFGAMPPISVLRASVADWPDGDARFLCVLNCFAEEDIVDTLDLSVMCARETLPDDQLDR